MPSVGDGHEDILVHLAFGLIHLLDDRVGDLRQTVHLTLEHVQCCFRQFFGKHGLFLAAESLLVEWHFHSKHLHHIFL